MYRDPRAPLIIAGLLCACGGPEDGLSLSFSHQALLEQTDQVEVYFYGGDRTCEQIRTTIPRGPSLHGPFAVNLDDESRQAGISFTRTDIDVGVYLIWADATAAGMIIGSGCAPQVAVESQRLSKIDLRIDLKPPG